MPPRHGASPITLSWSSRRRMRARGAAAICAAALHVALVQGETHVSRPYAGITYSDRVESSPRPVHLHVAQIDLTAKGLRFAVSPPRGSRETIRQRTADFVKEAHA